MDRPQENQVAPAAALRRRAGADVAGRYRCAELDAELDVVDAGGALYGGFSGFLGQGRMELLDPVGADVWALPCPRALDHTPPGDWTLAFRRDAAGRVAGVDARLLAGAPAGLRARRLKKGEKAGEKVFSPDPLYLVRRLGGMLQPGCAGSGGHRTRRAMTGARYPSGFNRR